MAKTPTGSCPGRERARRGGARRAGGPRRARGLVYSETKCTRNGPVIGETGGLEVVELTVEKGLIRVQRACRSTLTAARLIEEAMNPGGRWQVVMLTPTYRPGSSWRPQHVRELLHRVKAWARRNGVSRLQYVWVAELQTGRMAQHGASAEEAVHYHILLWLPRDLTLPKADKRGWWPHGMTRTERARHAVAYLAKYTSKLATKAGEQFPRGLRICGSGGLCRQALMEKRWWLAPRWVRAKCGVADDVVRCAGGWMARATGEFFRSPWVLVARGRRWEWITLRNTAPPPLSVEVPAL